MKVQWPAIRFLESSRSAPPPLPRSDALRSPWPGYTRENVFTGRPFRFKWTRDGQEETERERERVARSAKLRGELGWLRLRKERGGQRGGFRFFCPLSSIRFLELILLVELGWWWIKTSRATGTSLIIDILPDCEYDYALIVKLWKSFA